MLGVSTRPMLHRTERFLYPFTATTVIARKLVPLLLFTLGGGLFLWAGREYFFWRRPWAIWPAALLGALAWLAAGYFFTLLRPVRAGPEGLFVRRWGLFWQFVPWEKVAGVRETARLELLGWSEPFYTVYVWRPIRGRRGRVRRDWHRRRVRGFRFSGHIRNGERLLELIRQHADPAMAEADHDRE